MSLKSFDFTHLRSVTFADIRSKPSANGSVEFSELTEEYHRKYLQNFFGLPSLKKAFGDLSSTIEPQLENLRGYIFVDQQQ